jgi:Flp pilus assembly protein TadG
MEMSKTNRTESGVATIEFALTSLLWVPLLLGTLVYGAELIRAMQAVQVARDVSNLYAGGMTFSTSPNLPNDATNRALIARLGKELNLQTSGGSGLIILTTIKFISQRECDTLTSSGVTCTNLAKWVVAQRSTIGDTSLMTSSRFTTDPMPAADFDDGGNVVSATITNAGVTYTYPVYLTDNALKLKSTFNLLTIATDGSGYPLVDANKLPVGYGAGTSAYLVEASFRSTPFPPFRNNAGIYVVTLF